MSFPSGHAASAGFLMTFVYYYLNNADRQVSNPFLRIYRLFIILSVGAFVIFCCATRITDYWHYPSDVIIGFIISIIIFNITLKHYK